MKERRAEGNFLGNPHEGDKRPFALPPNLRPSSPKGFRIYRSPVPGPEGMRKPASGKWAEKTVR